MLVVVGVDTCRELAQVKDMGERWLLTLGHLSTPAVGILALVHDVGVEDTGQLNVGLDGSVLLLGCK